MPGWLVRYICACAIEMTDRQPPVGDPVKPVVKRAEQPAIAPFLVSIEDRSS